MRFSGGLTPEQIARRRNSLGGSDANILMSGDDDALMGLWLLKTGQKEPDDLSRVLPVVMGQWTEELNRHWYEVMTGREVHSEGLECLHPDYAWQTCTLDGLTTTERGEPAVFEAKHVNAFSDAEAVAQKYMPQVTHAMGVTGLNRSILSVFVGTLKYELFEIAFDPFYAAELMEREEAFWRSVQTRTPPVAMPAVAGPKVSAKREADMSSSNSWAMNAAVWIETCGTPNAGGTRSGTLRPWLSRTWLGLLAMAWKSAAARPARFGFRRQGDGTRANAH